ncbi:MAG TPA: YdcF family protein [Gammaproteobacteria bacterium]|nr:YdcF family protein [Gammaproteobacteria bacterium]
MTAETLTIKRAAEIWNYLAELNSRARCDAIVLCCSYDLRTCDHACELMHSGYADTLLLSGNTGNWTRHIWSEPEAKIYYRRARSNGIAEEQIIVESAATNFGENITFSRKLLPNASSVTFVSKPYSLLRVKLTVDRYWPGIEAHFSAPEIIFPDAVSNVVGVLGVIDEMVGDIDRIQRYPVLGYQAPHTLPAEIIGAWRYLIAQGFTHHLVVDHDEP